MGFEVYFQFYGEAASRGVPRSSLRALFPIVEAESKPHEWHVRYDNENRCIVDVSLLDSDAERIVGMMIDRPCGDQRLWEAMLSILRMGAITFFWPGGPPIIADAATAPLLPLDMIESIGEPRTVRSAEEVLQLLKAT